MTAAWPAACLARNAPTKSRRLCADASSRSASSGALSCAVRTSSRLTAMMRSRMSLMGDASFLRLVLELLRKLREFVDLRSRAARRDRFASDLNAVGDRRRHVRRIERRAGVERDNFARHAGTILERFDQDLLGFAGIAHFQRAVRRHLQAEVFRMDF